MKTHEYQAKEILAQYGVPVPGGSMVETVDDAVAAAESMGGDLWVVKAQIHAGGRGKGGGVKLCRSLDEVRQRSAEILGMNLVTPQTGPQGQLVRKLLVTAGCSIAKEYYVGVLLDRQVSQPLVMASAEGGVEIEEVAANEPEKIFKEHFSADAGLQPYQGRVIAKKLGFSGKLIQKAASLLVKLARTYLGTDASLVEINPLVFDGGRRARRARREVQLRRPTLFFVTPRSRSIAISTRKSRRRFGPVSSTSATSSWTATSAVWSTAPGWRWRRWTSSSSSKEARPTFWTSGVERPRRR